ncbi:MAG: hypothetical protein QM808_07050 [Steroidobacteraceae bacterium]
MKKISHWLGLICLCWASLCSAQPTRAVQYAQVAIAQSLQAQSNTQTDRAIGVCALIENQEISRYWAVNIVEPLSVPGYYLRTYENKEVGVDGKVTLLVEPKHGKLEAIEDTPGAYYYVPNSFNYRGFDTATFVAEVDGYSVKVVYWFSVLGGVGGGTEGGDPYQDKENCPQGSSWKISLSDPDVASFLARVGWAESSKPNIPSLVAI